MNEIFSIPLIKEGRVSRITEALNCIDTYPYNREKQSACILKLYPGKTEKSVFRGMIIPTLRYLGLIIGFGKAIRLSSNGKIIVEAEKKEGIKRSLEVARAVFLEIDKRIFGFTKVIIQNSDIAEKNFNSLIYQKLEDMPQDQKEERIKKWLGVLHGCKLIEFKEGKYIIHEKNHEKAEKELDARPKRRFFKEILFKKYNSASLQETAGVIDIPFLRQLVAMDFFEKRNMIMTESQFDKLLGGLPLVTNKYVISLGQPMGAEEKLFRYKGKYYRTLSITFFGRKVKR